jgi:hypothetical protein
LESSQRESLLKKVIVRFRFKAGKNGQLFPQRSWMSGLLIISSQRIILASGPFHHIIPYNNLLSIEDDGAFPLPAGGKVQVMPIVHTSGMDAYLTIVGVTGSVMQSITRDLYEQICNHFKGCVLKHDGKRMQVRFARTDNGIEIRSATGLSILISPETVSERKIIKQEDGWVFRISGEEAFELHCHSILGRWIELFLGNYLDSGSAAVEERYIRVLKYLSDHPSTTISMTSNLGLVALEASTILNEMIFLGWVAIDHVSKLYQITDRGAFVMMNSGDSSLDLPVNM